MSDANVNSKCNQTDNLLGIETNYLVENDSSPFLKGLSLTFLIVMPLYTFFCVGIFLYYRNSYYWLYKRNLTMLLLFCTGVLLSLYPSVWRVYSDPVNFSCTHLWISMSVEAALLLTPFITRLTNVLLRIRFNKALIEYNFRKLKEGTFFETVPVGSQRFVSNEKTHETSEKEKESWFQTILFKLFCWQPEENIPKELHFKYFWSLYRVSNTAFILFFSFLVLFPIVGSLDYIECTGCSTDEGLIKSQPAVIVLILFLGYVVNSHKSIPDGLGVKHEMKLIGIVILILSLSSFSLYISFPHFESEGIFVWSHFHLLAGILMLTISFPYQVYLAKTRSSSSYNDNFTFEDLLNNEKATKAFALYLATTLCAENLFFYKEVSYFKKEVENRAIKPDKLAISIFNKYISSDGSMTINISHKLRDSITEQVENKNFDLNMFDKALRAVVILMEGDLFIRFKNTLYYQAFIGNINKDDLKVDDPEYDDF